MAETSIFEVARQTHEEVERYEQAVADVLGSSAAGHKEQLKRAHQASDLLDRIVSRSAFLDNFYRDVAGERAREMEAIGPSSSDDAMSEFYDRLAKVKDYHKRYPGASADAFQVDFSALEATGSAAEAAAGLDFVDRMFSGEEAAGRFLDLYVHHDAFLNLKGVRRISYLQYIDILDKIAGDGSRIPDETKRTEGYRRYLRDLQAYLLAFLRKTRPLQDIDMLELTTLATFEDDWDNGRLAGWEDGGARIFGTPARAAPTKPSGDGIWCEACARSFAKQTVFDAHLQGAKHTKAAQRLANGGAAGQSTSGAAQGSAGARGDDDEAGQVEQAKRRAKAKAMARDEALIQAAEESCWRRGPRRGPTGGGGGGGDGDDDDDDDDEGRLYNPRRLPLGWDGKPIPYWLYKLHGLGVEFKCEICSDYVYQGRKNFERHFSESRHAFGMRALGLPNTKHFYEITRIEDALARGWLAFIILATES
ncbi:hypothetical protein L7F22_065614 [Adiantum nelumboides]|nr:hypothetical protein [Adiantum nelumboides]